MQENQLTDSYFWNYSSAFTVTLSALMFSRNGSIARKKALNYTRLMQITLERNPIFKLPQYVHCTPANFKSWAQSVLGVDTYLQRETGEATTSFVSGVQFATMSRPELRSTQPTNKWVQGAFLSG